ncbi:Metallo-dependent phosphatase-like protein [Syncephalis plumigaleata]|nr:Metallo-dependent phosphatase-like protein [Syncephalis plumigaleata]
MSVWHDTNHASFKNASALRKRRIVAVGDLHGDMSNSLAVLRMAGIIDRNNNWAGGDNTVFVQTGDVIDRGPDTIDLLKFLPKLIMQANKAGGRAIQILGNHEIMNIGGELKHVSEADYKTFNDKAARKAAFNGNGLLGKRLFKLPVVHQVGDTVFAHGGISQAWAKIGLRSTNERATKIMPEYAKEGVKLDSYESSAIGPTGPAWYRDFAKGDESEVCANLAASLKALGATRMVVGHTFRRMVKFYHVAVIVFSSLTWASLSMLAMLRVYQNHRHMLLSRFYRMARLTPSIRKVV